jgi:molybdenum-dependent DNA-binding transcriptional regulator ModE
MRIQQKKVEAESQQRKGQLEARVTERRARVEQRIAAQEEKIRRATEEREQREAAYQALLSRTREFVLFPTTWHCLLF